MCRLIHQALSKALGLGHSHRTLTILKSILEDENEENHLQQSSSSVSGDHDVTTAIHGESTALELFLTSLSGTSGSALNRADQSPPVKNRLDKYVAKWSDTDIEKIVTYLKDWNTNAKNSYVCTLVLDSLFQTQGYERLMSLPELVGSLAAIISYSERHYQRMNKLHQSTYITDYILSVMTSLPTTISPLLAAPMQESNKRKINATVPVPTKLTKRNEANFIPNIFGTK